MKSLFGNTPTENQWRPPELPSLTNVDVLSVDCETTGLNFLKDKPVGVSIAYYEDTNLKSFYLPFGHSSGNLDLDKVKYWMRSELAFKTCVFANAKFDLHQLKNLGVDLENMGVEPVDVQFAGALLDDSRWSSVSLDNLGKKYLGKGKLEFNGKGNMKNYPAHVVEEYAKIDAQLTIQLHATTLALLQKEGLGGVYTLENSLIYPVCNIERNGCRIDVNKLERMLLSSTRQYAKIIYEIQKQTGIALNPFAAVSMKRLFKQLNIEVPIGVKRERNKKTGEYEEKEGETFAEPYLKKINHPVVQLALKAKQVGSVKSKFLVPYSENLDSNNQLYYALHQLKTDGAGTISGRFSSSGGGDLRSGYSFNVQQCSTKKIALDDLGIDDIEEEEDELTDYPVRELFIPDDGYQWMACDARQIEYRLFVHFSQSKEALQAYKQDELTQYHNLVHDMLKRAGSSIDYKSCKCVNFARLYGAGAKKISRMTGMDLKATKQFLRLYDKILPEAKIYMEALEAEAEQQGYIRTPSGRKARFNGQRPAYTATNCKIQGAAADVFKRRLANLYQEKDNLGIYKLRQPVHDEFNADCVFDPLLNRRLLEFMDQQDFEFSVPVLWDGKYGKNWKDCK